MQKLCLYIVIIISCISLKAQADLIHNRQRAIFLYNFTRQIGWPEPFEVFKIGVLGEDQIIPEIERLIARDILVQGRPMELVELSGINEIVDLQLVYLNKNTGFDIAEVLATVQGKGILIVSENYPYNSAMINMALVDGNFEFEIQRKRMEDEGFELTSSFKNLAITTANRWQELYEKSSISLKEEREKVERQKKLIDEQEKTITGQTRSIEDKTEELNKLLSDYDQLVIRIEEQERLFSESTNRLNSVEQSYNQTLNEISERKREIEQLDSTLQTRQQQITTQSELISIQDQTLQTQRRELDYQKNFSILSVAIAILALLTGVFIWKNYREKKKSNIALEEKNREIEATSEELKIVNKEMEQFAYLASHDLQEPLNTITGWIQMLDRESLDEQGSMSVNLIDNATNRMRGLIRGLLEYSKLGSHIELEEIDSSELVRDVLTNLTKVVEDKQAGFEISDLPKVKGHYHKLSMLFQNLISNSLKFTAENVTPRVKIEAKRSEMDGFCQFSLTDNGIGISKNGIDKVFEIFHREHSKDKYEGTGIGLAHVRKIVELHRGKIWVESTLGEGTTFHFTLPEA